MYPHTLNEDVSEVAGCDGVPNLALRMENMLS
jgi:hypothetical protein